MWNVHAQLECLSNALWQDHGAGLPANTMPIGNNGMCFQVPPTSPREYWDPGDEPSATLSARPAPRFLTAVYTSVGPRLLHYSDVATELSVVQELLTPEVNSEAESGREAKVAIIALLDERRRGKVQTRTHRHSESSRPIQHA